jgi:hypothetical protein
MPALAERTKINKEWSVASTTQGWDVKINMPHFEGSFPLTIDKNAYDLVSGSTRFVSQSYLPTPSAKAKEFIRKLHTYKNLPENWDSNGAVAPEEQIVLKACLLILSTDDLDLPLYFVAPGPNGEVVVDYKNGINAAEVFLNEDGTEEMILYKGKEQAYAGDIKLQLLVQHLS